LTTSANSLFAQTLQLAMWVSIAEKQNTQNFHDCRAWLPEIAAQHFARQKHF
jgi:hypothetical protein